MIFAVKEECMYATKRYGFAMILAILVILLVALGGVMLLSNAAQSNKSVGDNYLRAQAELLAQSATEYAVMRVQGFDQPGCLNQLNITVKDASGTTTMFDIAVSMHYSFRGAHPTGGTCNVLDENTSQDTRVLIDTTVVDHNLSTDPIQIHQRSWQAF